MPQWTPEQAREYASKGGQASAERAERRRGMTPEQRVKEAFQASSEMLADELIDAALGRGDFEELDPKIRITAIVKAMEYGLGKPNTGQSISGPEPEKKQEAGIEFV